MLAARRANAGGCTRCHSSGTQAGEVAQLREIAARRVEQIDRLLAEREAEPANGHEPARRARKRAEG